MPMGAATGQPQGLKGTGYEQVQMPNFSPEQMQLFQRLFGQSGVGEGGYLSKLAGGDQSQFEQMEAPALKQFSALQGGLASRFSGGAGESRMGSARNSSGFQNAMNQQSSDFAQQLMSNRMNLQRQAMLDLRGMSSELLGAKPYENFMQKEKKPWWHDMIAGGAPIIGAGLGGLAGSFIPGIGTLGGATLGGQLGGAIGNAFSD